MCVYWVILTLNFPRFSWQWLSCMFKELVLKSGERWVWVCSFCFSTCDIDYHGPFVAVFGSKARHIQLLYWCGPLLCFYIHHEILGIVSLLSGFCIYQSIFSHPLSVDVVFSVFYVPWQLSIEHQDAPAPSRRWAARLTSDWKCSEKRILCSCIQHLLLLEKHFF